MPQPSTPHAASRLAQDSRTRLPDAVLRHLDLAPGEVLRWQLRDDGTVRLTRAADRRLDPGAAEFLASLAGPGNRRAGAKPGTRRPDD